MKISLKRRTAVRLLSYLTALCLVLAGFAIQGQAQARAKLQAAENGYMRTLSDLVTHMDTLQAALTKASFAGTAPMLRTLSAKMSQESGYAKQAVATLPLQDISLENTNKFLAQVGDYAVSLADRMSLGETLSGAEYDTLASLRDYCERLYREILVLQDEAAAGSVKWDDRQIGDEAGGFAAGLQEFENSFADYPTLLYDGPFSDHLLEREAQMIKGKTTVAGITARSTAARALHIDPDALTEGVGEEGSMECYTFSAENGTRAAAVTVGGGYLCYTVSGRAVGTPTLSMEDGVARAAAYLTECGYDSMTASYYEESGGVLTCNFAYQEGDYLCYTDLIKVSVALDNGEILGIDARGFLVNHTDRAPHATLDETAARRSLSPALTVTGSRLCIIPTDGMTEVPCYEFLCTTEQGDRVLVYIRTDDGREQEIMLLLEDSHGVMTI